MKPQAAPVGPPAAAPSEPALRIAVLGAESTGKTTLAQALQQQLASHCKLRVAWVPELLREWCDREGRTPQAHEQAAIMRQQHQRIDEAAALHQVVVCDTTALMTAVYSQIVFGDTQLHDEAVALHSSVACTLLTALDLPWVADGVQRDGPQVQLPVDQALRALLNRSGIAFSVVSGEGEKRVLQAMAAIRQVTQLSRS